MRCVGRSNWPTAATRRRCTCRCMMRTEPSLSAASCRPAAMPRKAPITDRAEALAAAGTRVLGLQSVHCQWQDDGEVVSAAVRRDGRQLRWASEALRDAYDVVHAAVSKSGHALKYASQRMRKNEKVAMAAIAQNVKAALHADQALFASRDFVLFAARAAAPSACEEANMDLYLRLEEPLRRDAGIVIALMNGNGALAQRLLCAAEMGDNEEVVLAAVRLRGACLQSASPALRGKRTVVLEAVRQRRDIHHCSRVTLEYASSALKDDEDVVMEAVAKDGRALVFASERLRASEDVLLRAVKSAPEAFCAAPWELKGRKAFAVEAVRQNGGVYYWMLKESNPLTNERDVVLAALSDPTGRNLRYVPLGFLQEKSMALAVARVYGRCLFWHLFQRAHGRDVEVLRAAVRQDGSALQYVKRSGVKESYKSIVLDAVRAAGTSLQWAGGAMRFDKDVVLQAVKQDGLALQFACTRLREDRDVVGAAVRQERRAATFSLLNVKSDLELRMLLARTPTQALACVAAATRRSSVATLEKDEEAHERFLLVAEEATHIMEGQPGSERLFEAVQRLLRGAMDQQRGFLGKRDRAAYEAEAQDLASLPPLFSDN